MNNLIEKIGIIVTGAFIGIISVLLVIWGNPGNMGFDTASFLRDIAGGLGFHHAVEFQYVRPEILGLIVGALIMALARKEFRPKGGSSPISRFVVGFFIMVGALVFLGSPIRMLLRIAGGDLNALTGLIGLICGIFAGVLFLSNGFSLRRANKVSIAEGSVFSTAAIILLVVLLFAPSFLNFTEHGMGIGAEHAFVYISLAVGIAIGALAQRTRFCMIGGFRDYFLFNEWRLLLGFLALLISAFIFNIVTDQFMIGLSHQPVAHKDGLWNLLSMLLVGFGSTLLGGCPVRQTVMATEGNTDSAITLLGMFVGVAFAQNMNMVSLKGGPTMNGKIAVVIGLLVVLILAFVNTAKMNPKSKS